MLGGGGTHRPLMLVKAGIMEMKPASKAHRDGGVPGAILIPTPLIPVYLVKRPSKNPPKTGGKTPDGRPRPILWTKT